MAVVNFKKGLLANLPANRVEGTIYITTDERAMYVDVDASTRIRIGDFQEFATLATLQANANPSTTALYYVTELNALAKWNGTQYVQINTDTGATSVEVVGDGNAVTAASYDETTRKLTLTKGETFATKAEFDALDSFIGEIPEGYTEENIVAYVNKKAEETLASATGGSSESAASVLAALNTYKSENDPKVAALQADSHTHANKSELDLIAAGDKAKWDAEIGSAAAIAQIKDGDTIDSFKDVETALAGKQATGDYATKTEAQGYADAKDADIAAAKKAGDDAMAEAQGKVASVTAADNSMTVAGTATAPTIAAKLSEDADNALELAEDGLKVVIPAAAEYSVVKDETSADYAAVYHLTKGGVNVGAAINIPKDMVVESGSVVELADGEVEGYTAGTYIKLVLANAGGDVLYINVNGLIEYVTSGSAAGDMVVIAVSDDHKVTATITDGSITLTKLATDVQTAIGKAHSHTNAAVLDTITEAKTTAWDSAAAKEHEHANKDLLDTYTQTEANLADAVAKKHSHANAEELDKIAVGDKEKWDAAAADTDTIKGDYLKAADKTALEEYADQVEVDANAYTDGLLTWGTF